MKLNVLPPNVILSAPQKVNIKLEHKKPSSMSVKPPVARDSSAEVYEGPYIANPSIHNNTTFYTKNKMLLDNVTVTKIPYFETSNQSGITAYIASEV